MSILKSKITLLVSVTLIAVFGALLCKTYYKERGIQAGIRDLEKNIAAAEEKNKELADLVQYFTDPAHLEKEARMRLNVKKPDEEVLVIPSIPPAPTPTPAPVVQKKFSERAIEFLQGLFTVERHY
jgi:cell division protein FtsB